LLGGGAYTIPRTLLAEDPALNIDVVEIEPRLFDLAHTYFELPEDPRLRNFVMDARTYLRTTDEYYDVIFADAFQSGHLIPPHLATREFFTAIKDRLTPDGVFIANVIGIRGLDEKSLTGSLLKTIQSVFPELSVYAAQPDEDHIHNMIIMARKDNQKIVLPPDFMIDLKNGSSTPASERERSLAQYHLDKQVILTDDLAPVELLMAKQILKY
jgi:Spermidine synthase